MKTQKIAESLREVSRKIASVKEDLKVAMKHLGKNKDEVLKIWNDPTPHFGGELPHRYNFGREKNCVYCNRPKNWKD